MKLAPRYVSVSQRGTLPLWQSRRYEKGSIWVKMDRGYRCLNVLKGWRVADGDGFDGDGFCTWMVAIHDSLPFPSSETKEKAKIYHDSG